MATVVSDTTLQATASKGRSGYSIVREFVVSDVTIDKDHMPWTALSDAGVPNTIGTPHPGQPLALLESVTATIAEPGSPQIYRVVCTYQTQDGGGSAPVYEYGTLVTQEERGWYLNAGVATRCLVYGRDDQNARSQQAASYVMEVHQPTITVTQNETGVSPGTIQDTYTNHINSATWQGQAAGKWLCTGIDFTTIDLDLVSYKVTYNFLLAPEIYIPNTATTGTIERTWDQIVFFKDENGVFPIDKLDFAAPHTQRVSPYDSVDFNALGI